MHLHEAFCLESCTWPLLDICWSGFGVGEFVGCVSFSSPGDPRPSTCEMFACHKVIGESRQKTRATAIATWHRVASRRAFWKATLSVALEWRRTRSVRAALAFWHVEFAAPRRHSGRLLRRLRKTFTSRCARCAFEAWRGLTSQGPDSCTHHGVG